MFFPQHFHLPQKETFFLILLGASGYFIGFFNPLLHLPLAIFLSPAIIYYLTIKSTSFFQAVCRTWALGTLGFSSTLYWLIYPMHEVGELPFILAIPCIIVLGGYLALFIGLAAGGLYTLSCKLFFLPEHKYSIKRHCLATLAFGCIYAGFEEISAFLFTGFPWMSFSTAFAPWTLWVQGAHLIGALGLTACWVFLSSLCTVACFLPRLQKIYLLGCVALCFLLFPLYGTLRLNTTTAEVGLPLTVGLIQGNINQNQKWQHNSLAHSVRTYINISQKLLAENKATHPDTPIDMLLWPETAMPFVFALQDDFALMLRKLAKEEKIWLGFGTLGYVPQSQMKSEYLLNRLQLIAPSGFMAGHYDKIHLVPFGEYTPFTQTFPFLEKIMQGISFSAGIATDPLLIPLRHAENAVVTSEVVTSENGVTPHIALGPLICYEVIFPSLAQKMVAAGATAFVSISNDGWFGLSSAPWQHLYLASMRSIEQFRPLIRSTNTGLTAIIDKYGHIQTLGSLFTQDTQIVQIYAEKEHTAFYAMSTYLHTFFLLCALLSLVFTYFNHVFIRKKI